MRKFLLLFAVSLQTLFTATSQDLPYMDTIRWDSLIISEVAMWGNWGYVELCNTSSDTIDLANYFLATQWNDRTKIDPQPYEGSRMKYNPQGKLGPGDTYILSGRGSNNALLPSGEMKYPNGYTNIYWDAIANHTVKNWEHDIGVPGALLINQNLKGLVFRGDMNGDSIRDSLMVDQFWFEGQESHTGKPDTDLEQHPIAGVITNNPPDDFCYIRKFRHKVGNPNFDISVGANLEDSEWIPVPKDDIDDRALPFTTLGTHMFQTQLDISSTIATINVNANTITVPYGTRRDSLIRIFNVGPNITWDFKTGNDSSQFYVSPTDSIDFYTIGDERTKYSFAFEVTAKPAEFEFVRPILTKQTNGSWTYKYFFHKEVISQIPYSEPIDTLIKYIIVEEGASREFIWVDGMTRPEVKDGDIMRITSGGKVKDYILSVEPYYPSYNSDLKTVYFPGLELWENPISFEYTDTFLAFVPDGKFYNITLPEETETSPAMVAIAKDNKARVHIQKAKNLFGTDEDRTATVTVTAENDTSKTVYTFLFDVARETPPVVGEPFISDISAGWGGNFTRPILQFYNPTEDYIDLGDYMLFVRTQAGSKEEIGNNYFGTENWGKNNKNCLRPGYVIRGNDDMLPVFEVDEYQKTFELEGNGTYTIVFNSSYPVDQKNAEISILDRVDFAVAKKTNSGFGNEEYWLNRFGGAWDPYGITSSPVYNMNGGHQGHRGQPFILFKILSDSVKDGTKPVGKNFAEDFEIVDIVGGLSTYQTGWTYYDLVDSVTGLSVAIEKGDHMIDSAMTVGPNVHRNGGMYRKPHVYTGNTKDDDSFGAPGKPGEWVVYGTTATGSQANELPNGMGSQQMRYVRFDNHIMLTYAHIPYITSNVYMVSRGIEGDQDIKGVEANTSVDGFMQNIDKPDTAMTVIVTNATGNEQVGDAKVQSGWKVQTTSANGLSSVTYIITVGTLDDDCSLTAKAGSGYEITGTKSTASGVIAKVPFGITLQQFADNLIPAATATMEITNGNGEVIPFKRGSAAEVTTENREYVDVLARESYVVEVTAQDGVTKIAYAIQLENGDIPYIISDFYQVNQDEKKIKFVGYTNVETFLSKLIASPGATMWVSNRMNQKRENGIIQRTDGLWVAKGDKQVFYYLDWTEFGVDPASKVKHVEFGNASVYPNPTQGMLYIESKDQVKRYEVRTLTGALLGARNMQTTSFAIAELNNQQAGIYMVTLQFTDGTTVTRKIVKQ